MKICFLTSFAIFVLVMKNATTKSLSAFLINQGIKILKHENKTWLKQRIRRFFREKDEPRRVKKTKKYDGEWKDDGSDGDSSDFERGVFFGEKNKKIDDEWKPDTDENDSKNDTNVILKNRKNPHGLDEVALQSDGTRLEKTQNEGLLNSSKPPKLEKPSPGEKNGIQPPNSSSAPELSTSSSPLPSTPKIPPSKNSGKENLSFTYPQQNIYNTMYNPRYSLQMPYLKYYQSLPAYYSKHGHYLKQAGITTNPLYYGSYGGQQQYYGMSLGPFTTSKQSNTSIHTKPTKKLPNDWELELLNAGVPKKCLQKFEKAKCTNKIIWSMMTDKHLENMGLSTLGERLQFKFHFQKASPPF